MMYTHWQNLVPQNEKAGIIIDALQRFMQFDTFAGALPAGGLEKLFTSERIGMLIQQATIFYEKYHHEFDTLYQNMREEMIRAHLAGFIKLPIPSHDHWRESFAELHRRNHKIYEQLSTVGRVELLLQRHPLADIAATTADHYLKKHHPDYTPKELVNTVLMVIEYYQQHEDELADRPLSEQRETIRMRLEGK
jgi:hypothetical protein